jgi:hypothetical protein
VEEARGDAGLSSVSLESGLGTISFDGQILEFFGFGEEGSQRFHVGQIQSFGVAPGPMGDMVSLDVGPASPGLKMAMKLSDKDRAGIEALIDEVMAAKGGAGG